MTVSLIIPAYMANEALKKMTLHCLLTQREEVQTILIAANAPYTVNTNNGLRAATGDIIVIGNNDLVFPEKWLDALLKPLQEGYDLSTVWTSDQEHVIEDRIESGVKFGSLFAMKRKVYETIGGFDETFKGYFADTDYRRRVLEAGFKIGRNNNALVHHKAKATYKVLDKDDLEYQEARILYEGKHGYNED